jgi:hypothetical protein
MGLDYADLNDTTRQHMLTEFNSDLQAGTLYISNYLSAVGRERYSELLREAIEDGDDDSLAAALAVPGIFDTHHQRRKPKGGFTQAKVPHTANTTLAEGEFNRFYLCAASVCARLPKALRRLRSTGREPPRSRGPSRKR